MCSRSYPLAPAVSAVIGCSVQTGLSTQNCPTRGNVPITVIGQNFIQGNSYLACACAGFTCAERFGCEQVWWSRLAAIAATASTSSTTLRSSARCHLAL